METLQSDQLEEKPTQKQTLPSISVSTILLSLCVVALLVRVELITNRLEGIEDAFTLGTRGNSLAKSGRPKAGKTSVRSEVSEASEGPNASSLW